MYVRTDDQGKRLANQALTSGIDIGEDGEATIRLAEPLASITEPETSSDVSGSSTSHREPSTVCWLRTSATGVSGHPRHRPCGGCSAMSKARLVLTGVRTDRIDKSGVVTLRHDNKLHHIGVGRTHAGTYVRILVQDLDIIVINATTGEILRELVLDPTKDYQPTGRPRGPAPRHDNGGPTIS